MKKFLSILMACAMMMTTAALAGCGKSDDSKDTTTTPADKDNKPAVTTTLKLGLGLEITANATDATEDKAGQGQVTTTAAAVLVDADGKIVKAFIDCADNKLGYTADGKAVANESFKSKYELGSDYGMVAYGGSTKEWFEQADAFCALIVGKTADEVKALVVDGDKGTDEVLNAGCTITIVEFANAVVKAVENAIETTATADAALKLGVSTTQTTADATEDKAGSNKTETYFFAAAVGADGKVITATSDCVQADFKFDLAGKSQFDATKPIISKKVQGADYGMVAYGGATKEWFEQAAAFDAACAGKTVAEIEGIMGDDNKGDADLQAAGCTIIIDGFVKAAAKIG
ncbi:MAG: hypothetical protein E7509_02670 [Ruminococcus sp.]|nr:hypothetical protein [Ruminococcus sp.]